MGEHAISVSDDGQHGVNDQMNDQAEAIDGHGDRIDQKRHIVGDNLDRAMGGLPSMLLDLGIVDANFGFVRCPVFAEAQMGESSTIEIERIPIHQIDRRNGPIVVTHEHFAKFGLFCIELFMEARNGARKENLLAVLQPCCHRQTLHCSVTALSFHQTL